MSKHALSQPQERSDGGGGNSPPRLRPARPHPRPCNPPSSPPTPSRLHCDSFFFFPSPILLHRLRRRPASDDDAFLALPRFFSPFPSPSSFVSFATSDDDASLPTLTPRRERIGGAVVAQERAHLVREPRGTHPSRPRRRSPLRRNLLPAPSFATAASPTPPSPSQSPPPRASFLFAAAASPSPLLPLRRRRLLAPSFPFLGRHTLRSRRLPRASFPFAAAASPMPSRGAGCGVAAHGNPAWAEVGALARRGALNARR
uniref:Uncharacterized protein n=1 Tax=Ananas comosus var. bracteatus TaxID=296719 RepID=A0A6V7PRP6_ANACO|nr:unnamed protein product [Ananas comosus var. bracteatus]